MGPGSLCCPSSGIAKPWQNLGASRALPVLPASPAAGNPGTAGWKTGSRTRAGAIRQHPSASINGESEPLLTLCISPPFLATLLTGAKLNTISIFFNRSRVASAGRWHRIGSGRA